MREYVPAIGEFCAHILQISVAHVVDREYKKMVIFLDRFTDIGKQASGLLFVVLLGGFGFVDETSTLGDRHFGGCCGAY
jgi:hypothetical protein